MAAATAPIKIDVATDELVSQAAHFMSRSKKDIVDAAVREDINAHRDEINEGIKAALGQLNGTAARVSLITGFSAEELDDLGGLPEQSGARQVSLVTPRPNEVPPGIGEWWIGAAGHRQADTPQRDFYEAIKREAQSARPSLPLTCCPTIGTGGASPPNRRSLGSEKCNASWSVSSPCRSPLGASRWPSSDTTKSKPSSAQTAGVRRT
jgi:hypothetical protein